MRINFNYTRAKESLDSLLKEQETLSLSVLSVKRDEKYELNRVKHDFSEKIKKIETRTRNIVRDIRHAENVLRDLKSKMDAADAETNKLTSKPKRNGFFRKR